MIPYYSAPVLRVGLLEIHPFGVLLASAIAMGLYVSLNRARRFGIDRDLLFRASFWGLICGLAGAHVAELAMDHTPQFVADPLIVFKTTRGIRSVGGLGGGLAGLLVYWRLRRVSLFETFRMLDVIAYALPSAWMIGRLGCTLAHDHPGLFTTSWIAVKFPEGSRYDLGLIEFLFLMGLSALFYWLDRTPRAVGYFFGLYWMSYGAFRIWLDTLDMQPIRFYEGMVWCCIGIAGWAAMLRFSKLRAPAGNPQSCPPRNPPDPS